MERDIVLPLVTGVMGTEWQHTRLQVSSHSSFNKTRDTTGVQKMEPCRIVILRGLNPKAWTRETQVQKGSGWGTRPVTGWRLNGWVQNRQGPDKKIKNRVNQN